MSERLIVLIAGERAGEIRMGKGGRLAFEYDPAWRAFARAIPYR